MATPTLDPLTRHNSRFGPHLPTSTMVAYWVAIGAVVIIALLSYGAVRGSVTNAQRVTHTLKLLEQLHALLSTMKDAETGQRGYLLTGEESYLEPYNDARTALAGEISGTRDLVATDAQQQQRLQTLEQLCADKMAELAQTIVLRRKGDSAASLAVVHTDRGRDIMDRIRAVTAEMTLQERGTLAAQQGEWLRGARLASWITLGGSAVLLFFIIAAALRSAHEYRARQIEAWIRTGYIGLTERIQGEQRLEVLGTQVLEFLANYMEAQAGAVYFSQPDGSFRRRASYALANGDPEAVHPGTGLLGQAAKENRALHVRNVPEGYLVASSLGSGKPVELLLAPASVEGTVLGVIELGFFRHLEDADRQLMARISDTLGIAVRAATDRSRLEDLLEETQRQGEELQTQQEELRVSNEELEVQANSLKESHFQLQNQQAELEQTNSQLEEQAQALGQQKDALARAQTSLIERATELERSNQYKSEFLANMSHELRTPLNSALILAKILSDNKGGNLTADQVRFARTISSAGNDLLEIINDVLDLSKVESGKVELIVETTSVPELVEQLFRSLQPMAQQKHLKLTTALDSNAPREMTTDPQRLAQILKNLLSNAIKFTDHGEISLCVSAEPGDQVAFAVQDSGIGVSEHQQAIIFEAFRQADGSTHRKYGGTGLGLTISRDLARLLGGDIAVKSQSGQGSTFTLTLPRVFNAGSVNHLNPAASLPAAPPAPTPAPTPARRSPPSAAAIEDDRERLKPEERLVLVIEDDTAFATILRDLAHEKGFQCVVTQTAADGVSAAALYQPKAILLDMNLPDLSGLGVLEQLKRNSLTRHIPVHIVSVADNSQEALKMGAVGYSLKPIRREQLVEALERLESKFSQNLHNLLVVEDDARQRESISQLLANETVLITAVGSAHDALAQLKAVTFDCMVLDLNLPDLSGHELLKRMSEQEDVAFPPVIVYTGRALSHEEEHALRGLSRSIIIKDARSPERLLDEVTLFLHQVESTLPEERRRMLEQARDRDVTLEGRMILIVEDDVRNIFALTSLLEPKGILLQIARNGREALEALGRLPGPSAGIELVLMDIMMPEMDGLTAMREIRKRSEWRKLPIIALTAKAMKDDQERCIAAGANDYIAKPLDVEKLLSLVRVWMPK